ncbi:D-2-hydroxyacid dehydrogenase [Demequina capsici]|uniref:D-2-hydroxyacid dehydrogenase n=1 Tax=Demequina capsici TaxID=3075620 RepID=A0AA96F8E0_9MICO|nr:D-2-hydroxyacid dehydrogenase [Demequina sp. OYTSA14]WNM23600.1 D-2-hydroxyacid dehydrogenase [Demequina sp. OYTSA14]
MAAGGGSQVRDANLPHDALQRVAFTTSAGVHASLLAEFALFGVLAGAKDLPRLRRQQDQRLWSGRWPMRALCDLTVLVVGMGHIGHKTAELLQRNGIRVVGVTRDGRPRPDAAETVPLAELTTAARRADALVNTLPATDTTEGLIDAEVLGALRPGATVVSVGRGSVIDEDALVRAIRSGTVGAAVLDVFSTEPLPEDSPLWTMPEVIVSPHTAANSPHEEALIAQLFVDNLERFVAGRPLRNRVDTVTFV